MTITQGTIFRLRAGYPCRMITSPMPLHFPGFQTSNPSICVGLVAGSHSIFPLFCSLYLTENGYSTCRIRNGFDELPMRFGRLGALDMGGRGLALIHLGFERAFDDFFHISGLWRSVAMFCSS